MPKWLSARAFLIGAAVTAIPLYPEMRRLDYSIEAVSGFVVGTVVGGIVWGAIFTWIVKRYFNKP